VIGLVVLALGWKLASQSVEFSQQWAPLGLSMVGTMLGGLGFGVWFVGGRRRVTQRRVLLADRLLDGGGAGGTGT
jgi:hypothetical protein